MKRLPLFLFVLASGLLSNNSAAQGFGATSAEEAKVISVLGLAPGKSLGEIGAGEGQLSIRAAKVVSPGGRVFATELSDKQATLKRNVESAGAANVEVRQAQAKTTSLDAGCCDAVLMRDVYHHLTAPDEILADIRKALKPEGRLLIIDFEPRTGLSTVEGVRENRRGHGIPMSVLVEELKSAGFEIVTEDKEWRSDLYAVVARRPKS
ncbi:MAG: class I SAM-dependent methyltransferase [Vicinamibacteria bacterium]